MKIVGFLFKELQENLNEQYIELIVEEEAMQKLLNSAIIQHSVHAHYAVLYKKR